MPHSTLRALRDTISSISTHPRGPGFAISKTLSGNAIQAALTGLSNVVRLHPQAKLERHGVRCIQDIPYTTTGMKEHLLDVYLPPNFDRSGPAYPSVFFVHGGGFRILSKDSHWWAGLMFARRGYVVFNINYRLTPRYPYPCAVEDCADAFDFFARNAHHYHASTDNVMLAGESAGANLSLGLAISTCYQNPQPWAKKVWNTGIVPNLIMPACGYLQASDPAHFGRNVDIAPWLQTRIESVSEQYLNPLENHTQDSLTYADPLCFLERAPAPTRPFPHCFAPVGTEDPVIDDTRRLKSAMDRLDIPCEAPEYPGGHAFHAFLWTKASRACWDDAFAFFAHHTPTQEIQEAHTEG